MKFHLSGILIITVILLCIFIPYYKRCESQERWEKTNIIVDEKEKVGSTWNIKYKYHFNGVLYEDMSRDINIRKDLKYVFVNPENPSDSVVVSKRKDKNWAIVSGMTLWICLTYPFQAGFKYRIIKYKRKKVSLNEEVERKV